MLLQGDLTIQFGFLTLESCPLIIQPDDFQQSFSLTLWEMTSYE